MIADGDECSCVMEQFSVYYAIIGPVFISVYKHSMNVFLHPMQTFSIESVCRRQGEECS